MTPRGIGAHQNTIVSNLIRTFSFVWIGMIYLKKGYNRKSIIYKQILYFYNLMEF